jgi:hypothetical protein
MVVKKNGKLCSGIFFVILILSPLYLSYWMSKLPNYCNCLFYFQVSLGGGGWFEVYSTWLIHYKNPDSLSAVLLNSLKFCAPVEFIWFWIFFTVIFLGRNQLSGFFLVRFVIPGLYLRTSPFFQFQLSCTWLSPNNISLFLNLHHSIGMHKYIICQSFKKFHRVGFSISHPKDSNFGSSLDTRW